MGCDIHIVLERKNTGTGEWVGVRSYSGFSAKLLQDVTANFSWVSYRLKERHYAFFNDLCGVRGDGSRFGYTPRGLPENASSLSRLWLSEDDPDLHSHSWLNMKELSGPLVACKVTEAEQPELIAERMGNAGYNLSVLNEWVDDDITDENIDEWRLVFAFDN